MRVNLTKEEVNELSAEMTKQMFQEMHLQEIKQQDTLAVKVADTISYHQIFKEVKIAFPFVDTVINGWIMLPNSNQSIDTIPAVVYSTLRRTSKTQTNQFYNFLLARLATDTVALIKK
jgi:predicted small secreted protein